ncbi:MAG: serine/threonine protein phosphatase [Actinomycetaceae bacterium]
MHTHRTGGEGPARDGSGFPAGLTVFDHLRQDDGEHVGYIGMTEDGGFVPFDRLHRERGGASGLLEAEEVLDELGLGYLAETWRLRTEDGDVAVRIVEIRRDVVVVAGATEDMTAHVAQALDLTRTIEIDLPTDRLVPA